MKRAGLTVLALAITALLFVTGPVSAQIVPPVFTAIDRNHVDLLTGSLMQPLPSVKVGIDGEGLSENMTWINGLGAFNNVLFENQGFIHYSGSFVNSEGEVYSPEGPGYIHDAYTVSIGGSSENFFLENGVFVPQIPSGSTLTGSGGNYTYTMKDGSVATFVGYPLSLPNPYYNQNIALITQITKPDGEIKTYMYDGPPAATASNLISVSSNYGYQLNYYGWGALERDHASLNRFGIPVWDRV
jgi:hypothetical protein